MGLVLVYNWGSANQVEWLRDGRATYEKREMGLLPVYNLDSINQVEWPCDGHATYE